MHATSVCSSSVVVSNAIHKLKIAVWSLCMHNNTYVYAVHMQLYLSVGMVSANG